MNRICQGKVTRLELRGEQGQWKKLEDWKQALPAVAPKRSEGECSRKILMSRKILIYPRADRVHSCPPHA